MSETAQTILKKNKLKVTAARESVLNVLLSSSAPLTCEEIYESLQRSIDLSTIYRITEKLTNSSILSAVFLSGTTSRRYELNRHTHRHHLVCTVCGKILPLNLCPISNIEKQVEEQTGFVIKGHNLDIFGNCADCQKDK